MTSLGDAVRNALHEMRDQPASMAIALSREGGLVDEVAVEFELNANDADALYLADVLLIIVQRHRAALVERERIRVALKGGEAA